MSNAAANLALFLLKLTGSINGHWEGTLTGEEQRKLFGTTQLADCPIAGGFIIIDGPNETVSGNNTTWTWGHLDKSLADWATTPIAEIRFTSLKFPENLTKTHILNKYKPLLF